MSSRSPSFGLMGVFLELFSNPHGQLFSTEIFSITFSLRMAVFVGFFIGYFIYLIRTKHLPRLSNEFLFCWAILFFAILFGFLNGFLTNSPINAFKDGNAYLFLLYAIPIFSTTWNAQDKRKLLQVFSAGVVWNIFLSFFILYFFTHVSEPIIRVSYIFLRDVRLAEITNIGGSLYRVFIQTQFFSLVFGAFLLAILPKLSLRREKKQVIFLLATIIATLILSLSRSFVIGIFFALIVLFVFLIRFYKKIISWKTFGLSLVASVFLAIVFIFLIVLFPFPSQRVGGNELTQFFSRRANLSDDVAVTSRWKLLSPMIETIKMNPVVGNGFGKEVTFETDDPRAREIRPDGKWSTYAMEWGWLELWLKMGILGPLGFLIVFIYLNKRLMTLLKSEQAWIAIGLISGLVFLFATHTLSPYLNHPIGLGFILFTSIFIPKFEQVLVTQTSAQSTHVVQQEMPAPASALSLRVEE